METHGILGGVSSFFQPRSEADSWFQIGRLSVTTTVFATLLVVAGTVVGAFAGLISTTHFAVPLVIQNGELWRLFTWPFVEMVSIWTIITFLIFWYFGTFLEQTLGKQRMAWFLVVVWAVTTLAHVVAGILLPAQTVLYGLRMFQLVILLLFIAEAPRRRFFFGIPAWVLGTVILALQLLSMVSFRDWGGLLGLLLTLLGVAVFARRLGLLSEYDWLPGSPTRKQPKQARARSRTTRPARGGTSKRHMSDEERMDELLGKISAGGLHSLTQKERAELEKLRQRRNRN